MRSVSFGFGGLRRGPTGGAAADITHVLPHSHAVGYQGLALGRDLCHLAVLVGCFQGSISGIWKGYRPLSCNACFESPP